MSAFFDFRDLLGDELVTRGGVKATGEVLGGKEVVGLYFSAHWCPPCRIFTPQLGKFYEKMVSGGASFEVVFVSSDRDPEGFESYYGSQAPWAALPFGDRDRKDAVSKKFKVQGIPTFVVVDGRTGETITADGREALSGDPEGARFPWRPPTLGDALALLPRLRSKDHGEGPLLPALPGPVLLYFSAHWCPPCRKFTPELVAFFEKLKRACPAASLVFCSSDSDVHTFEEYYEGMGDAWLALPYEARDAKERLSTALGVKGIPKLVLLSAPAADGSRSLITDDGRACVAEDKVAGFPETWRPEPFGNLGKTVSVKGEDVNGTRSLLVLCEAMADPSAAIEALKALARQRDAPGPAETLFFFAELPEGPVDQIRKLCGIPGLQGKAETADLVLLDVPDNGGFYVKERVADVTVAALEAFLANPGDRRQLEAP